MHGGNTGRGIMNPSFKHGRYSQYVKDANLLETYHQILDDDELLSLRDEIAMLSARNAQLFDRLNGRDSRELWRKLRSEYKMFTTETDSDKRQVHLSNILRTIANGGQDFEIWAEISQNMETQRKLSDSERKRIIDAKLMITADRAMGLVIALVNAFKVNVQKYATDKQTANRILAAAGRDIDAIIDQNSGVNAESRN